MIRQRHSDREELVRESKNQFVFIVNYNVKIYFLSPLNSI
jgi:hypothetical protein